MRRSPRTPGGGRSPASPVRGGRAGGVPEGHRRTGGWANRRTGWSWRFIGAVPGERVGDLGGSRLGRHEEGDGPARSDGERWPRVAFPHESHHTRSTSANRNTVTDITPFMVKNAASSRERSPGFTSRCSYKRIPVAAARP